MTSYDTPHLCKQLVCNYVCMFTLFLLNENSIPSLPNPNIYVYNNQYCQNALLICF